MTTFPRFNAKLGAVALLLWGTAVQAGSGYEPTHQLFRLDAPSVTYAFMVTNEGALRSLYWGDALASSDPLLAPQHQEAPSSHDPNWALDGQEYPGWGGGLLGEAALKVRFADGNRDLVLRVRGHELSNHQITVHMADVNRPVGVDVHYQIDVSSGVVSRWAHITNHSQEPIVLDQVMSASATIPVGAGTRLHYLTGRWGAEFTLQERPIDEAPTMLESRRGLSGHSVNPWFAIGNSDTTESTGSVWSGALAWSGSWRITIERNVFGEARVTGGINPFDFSYVLAPGASLDTPVFYLLHSANGWGGASRAWHQFERSHILPQAPNPRVRPVLYNSWEATEFGFDENSQMAIADKAARLGVERFVMDDGWFGQRDSDRAGLGDWSANPRKFPHGLKPLIDHVHALGMDFGIWVEPEMVNPDSELYRQHPDWVMHFPGRPKTEMRNQLVLNLARPDVREYVFQFLDDLVSKNDIAFLKWDHNRYWSEPGWPERAPQEQQALYVEYVRQLYGILDELRRRHPKLEIETCAGGGGRVDLGILSRTDEAWTSDNTDPFDRLLIQDGFTQAYEPGLMMAWVTDSPNWVNGRSTSLAYRFLSAMQGSLGIGANLDKWSDADFALAKNMIGAYKQVRTTIQTGNLYRLESPRNHALRSATLSVSPDLNQAVLFAFTHSSIRRDPQSPIHLQGLDPQRHYRVRSLNNETLPNSVPSVASGQYWMHAGVNLPLTGDFVAAGLVFESTP